jgi:hypothetical protein
LKHFPFISQFCNFSETKEGMQQALDIFESYCEIWKLQVNVAKTKVMIFRKRKTAQDPKFILHGQTLRIKLPYRLHIK